MARTGMKRSSAASGRTSIHGAGVDAGVHSMTVGEGVTDPDAPPPPPAVKAPWADQGRLLAAALAMGGLGTVSGVAGGAAVASLVAMAIVSTAAIVQDRTRRRAPIAGERALGAVAVAARRREQVVLGARAALDGICIAVGQMLLVGPGSSQHLLGLAVAAPLPIVAAVSLERGRRAGTVAALGAVGCHLAANALMWVSDRPPGYGALVQAAGMAAVAAWLVSAASSTRDLDIAVREERARGATFRRTIITTVSHELRTPLTIIQGLTSMLASRWTDLPETKRLDIIDTLAINVASLDSSVLHFLDAGRLERGEWELRRETTQLQPVLEALVAKLEPVIAGRPVGIRIDIDTAIVDGEALGRVVELLLVNACRFSEIGAHVNVRISPGQREGVEVAVTDHGRGIPARDLPRIFDPMWRSDVKVSGVSRGAGLGLSIVRGIAQLHGGDVIVTSTKGIGTTFRVLLPGS